MAIESGRRAGRREDLLTRLDRAERHSAELALIAVMARELAQSLDLEVISAVIARTAIELTGAAESTVSLAVDGAEPRPLSTATGIPGPVIPAAARRTLLRQALATGEPAIIAGPADGPEGSAGSYAALPFRFDATVLGALELVGFPQPELLAEELETLQQALPIAALSLQNALTFRRNAAITEELRTALTALQEKQGLLEAQNGEIQAQSEELQAQNEEIQAQAAELQAQNDELAEQRRQLEAKNAEVGRINDELSRLYAQSRQQEAQLRAIVDATADGLMVVDAERRVISANPALQSLTGFAPDELIGRACRDLIDARVVDGEKLCDAACPSVHADGRCAHGVDATLTRRDGRQVWVNVTYGVIPGPDGQPTAIVHAIRDVSARKEFEQQKDEFLSMAAHDLKNPLTSIRGNAQLLKRRLMREPNRQEDVRKLDAIDRQVSLMLDLIGTLLDITRIQMGLVELHLEPTDVVALAERVVEQVQATTERHRLHLYAEPGSLVGGYDRISLERAIANLVENAVKYSAGGDVTVTVQGARGGPNGGSVYPAGLAPCAPGEAPSWLVVSVADQGIGIPREARARLFERYYRTAEASQHAKGFGLGLYITKGLVEAHGGHIWLESEPGQGSTFGFALPVRDVQ